jgi:hypothetical protein
MKGAFMKKPVSPIQKGYGHSNTRKVFGRLFRKAARLFRKADSKKEIDAL